MESIEDLEKLRKLYEVLCNSERLDTQENWMAELKRMLLYQALSKDNGRSMLNLINLLIYYIPRSPFIPPVATFLDDEYTYFPSLFDLLR